MSIRASAATMEWDTAAGDAVLRAAGGMTYGLDGKPMRYGKTAQGHDADFANGHFISWGQDKLDRLQCRTAPTKTGVETRQVRPA